MLLTVCVIVLLIGTAASAEDSSDVCPKENFSGDFFVAPLKYTEMIYAGATGNGGGLKSYVAGNTNWMSAIPDEYYLSKQLTTKVSAASRVASFQRSLIHGLNV